MERKITAMNLKTIVVRDPKKGLLTKKLNKKCGELSCIYNTTVFYDLEKGKWTGIIWHY